MSWSLHDVCCSQTDSQHAVDVQSIAVAWAYVSEQWHQAVAAAPMQLCCILQVVSRHVAQKVSAKLQILGFLPGDSCTHAVNAQSTNNTDGSLLCSGDLVMVSGIACVAPETLQLHKFIPPCTVFASLKAQHRS